MTLKNMKNLVKIYQAIGGLVSEQGFETFDHFYPGGGLKMDRDFQAIMREVGIEVEE